MCEIVCQFGANGEIEANIHVTKHFLKKVTVKCKAHYTQFWFHFLENFIYKHDKYIHPRYVLEAKNVSLFTVTKDYALFCVSNPKDDIYETKKYPFMFISQYDLAEKLIIMPISSFHRIAEEIGDPKVPVLINNMTARCGSTLLSQMFHRIPGVRVLSEPWASCTIHKEAAKGRVSSTVEYKAMVQSAFRLHCKLEPGEEVKWIFIKATMYHAPQFQMLAELFPNFVLTFNTRSPIPTFRSYGQLISVLNNTLFLKLSISWRSFVDGRYAVPLGPEWDKYLAKYNPWWQNMTDEESGIRLYSVTILQYLKTKSIYQRMIFYENLAKNPEKELQEIFKLINIPIENVHLALEALNHDSQNKTFGKRGQCRDAQLPKHMEDMMDDIFREYDIPMRKNMSEEDFMACMAL